MNYPSAASGLKMMFLAQILTIVGTVVMAVGLLLTVVSLGILFLVPLLGSLLIFIASLLSIWGLFKAGADDEGYRGALLFSVLNLVVGVISGLAPEDATFYSAVLSGTFSIIQSVLNFLVVNAVCQTTGNLLYSMGKGALSERGNTVSRLYLICTVITIVCTLVGAIPIVNILAGIANFAGVIITLVGYVLYMGFLSSGGRELEY